MFKLSHDKIRNMKFDRLFIKLLNIKSASAFAALIILYVLFQRNKPIMFFSLLLLMASVSRTYNHFFWLPQLGFELYSTSTILTGILLGPIAGALQGVLSSLFAYLLSGKIKFYAYISMAAWGLIGLVCGLIKTYSISFNVTYLGIFLVILYETVTTPLFIMAGARISSALFHTFTHILIVIFLFRVIVPTLYILLR